MKKKDTSAEDWILFKTTGDPAARDRLIVNYSALVRYVANRVGVGLPQNVEQGDLASYGVFGLIDAIDKFDPARGFKFETYAIARIKGAILDELRSIDWVPRSVRSKHRAIDVATRKLEAKLKRAPTEDELSDELEITIKQLRQNMASLAAVNLVALDDTTNNTNGEIEWTGTVADSLPDRNADAPDDLAASEEIAEMRQILSAAAVRMSEREQMVLALYYHEGLTLAEIGTVLGVTESRVCQIHTKAVLILRERLIDSEFEPA